MFKGVKKYLNTYKYGGSDGEIISSEPTTDDYLSTYEILPALPGMRLSLSPAPEAG